MMATSKHVFSVESGFYRYQVIDEDEGVKNAFHRHTVIKWKRFGFSDTYSMKWSDSNIYAQTKMDAIKAFNAKYKKEKNRK